GGGGEGRLGALAAQGREACARRVGGDLEGFWSDLSRDGDPLRWCGASPLYTLGAAVRPAAGALLHYEQWNIDEHSVVSCGAIAFCSLKLARVLTLSPLDRSAGPLGACLMKAW